MRSMRSSPERARALPESIRGMAAGFRECSRVIVIEVPWFRRLSDGNEVEKDCVNVY